MRTYLLLRAVPRGDARMIEFVEIGQMNPKSGEGERQAPEREELARTAALIVHPSTYCYVPYDYVGARSSVDTEHWHSLIVARAAMYMY